MRNGWWVAVVVLASSCVKTERDYQLEHAKSLTPKALGTADGPSDLAAPIAEQPPRVVRVRAWVDLDYQAQVLHWNERVVAQIAQASRLTESALHVELKLVSIESWNRPSQGAPLEAHLRALEKEDAGGDVDLVLGFVSSLQVFTDSHHELGLGHVLGRHAVVRAMDNAEEGQAITRVFTKLDEAERAKLYRERKLHKEVAVLLHEWAHTLGSPHDLAMDSLLNPAYAVQRSRFRPMTLQLLARSLEQRDAKVDRKQRATELAEFIRKAPEGSWHLADLKGALDDLDQVARGEDARAVALSSQRDRALFDSVVRLTNKGQHAEALAALQPLLTREPPIPEVQALGCQLSGMVNLAGPDTTTRCELAVTLSPTDGSAFLMLSQAHGANARIDAARNTYVSARTQFLASTRPVTIETHAALSSVARRLNFVSWAEQSSSKALGRAAADETVEWAARKRRWFGLPVGATSPSAEEEPAYVQRFTQAQNELSANQLPRAEQSIASLEKDFPALPGPLTLRCELWLRRSSNAKAAATCERALASYPDSLQARYLLGVMASMAKQHRKVIEHLEPVVAADTTVDDAWERLVTAYAALGDRPNRDRAQHRRPLSTP